ncbi:MAG: hypothetical protein ACM3N4_09680 [Nitrososphaerota archaeon]
MGTLDPETVDTLNMLLEDVRASVEIEVALSNGATEYLERDALTVMGVEDTLIAFLLRDWLESFDLPVTRRINGVVLQALDLTRYDDRLLLFVQHQLASREQAEHLLAENHLDNDSRAILRMIVDTHTRHAAWCEQRAREFAESRQLEFRRPVGRPRDQAPGVAEEDPLADTPSTSGQRSTPHVASSTLGDAGVDDIVSMPESPPAE